MKIFVQPDEMRDWSRQQRANGLSTGCVPTMGALHEGHVSLIEVALRDCDRVIVTVFVNSLQFNNPDDYFNYPQLMDADTQICRDLGVDALYCPSPQTMYPSGFETHVLPGPISFPLEGVCRPDHFTGVATVVTKLFNATQPDRAYFGLKDIQQLAVIERMVTDFDLGIKIISVPTVRQPDGLALSSRNDRLTSDQKDRASMIYRGLQAANESFKNGERMSSALKSIANEVYAKIPEARIEYIEIFEAHNFIPIAEIGVNRSIMAVAVWFGDVRLIDNIEFAM